MDGEFWWKRAEGSKLDRKLVDWFDGFEGGDDVYGWDF
jgi:hypothetical protein